MQSYIGVSNGFRGVSIYSLATRSLDMRDSARATTYKMLKVEYSQRVLTACTDPNSYTVRGLEQERSYAVLKFTHGKIETSSSSQACALHIYSMHLCK